MNPIVRNVLAVLAGFIVGSAVNMTLVVVGSMVVPDPEGVDMKKINDIKDFDEKMVALKYAMQKFTPAHFLFPFLAHALGTLVGAFLAAKLAASHGAKLALGIGGFFMIGGITMVVMVGGPIWFIAADLIVAYIPMGLLGAVLAGATSPSQSSPDPEPA